MHSRSRRPASIPPFLSHCSCQPPLQNQKPSASSTFASLSERGNGKREIGRQFRQHLFPKLWYEGPERGNGCWSVPKTPAVKEQRRRRGGEGRRGGQRVGKPALLKPPNLPGERHLVSLGDHIRDRAPRPGLHHGGNRGRHACGCPPPKNTSTGRRFSLFGFSTVDEAGPTQIAPPKNAQPIGSSCRGDWPCHRAGPRHGGSRRSQGCGRSFAHTCSR